MYRRNAWLSFGDISLAKFCRLMPLGTTTNNRPRAPTALSGPLKGADNFPANKVQNPPIPSEIRPVPIQNPAIFRHAPRKAIPYMKKQKKSRNSYESLSTFDLLDLYLEGDSQGELNPFEEAALLSELEERGYYSEEIGESECEDCRKIAFERERDKLMH